MNDMTTIKRCRERGFTLIEIAIVLVIIGLLLGGVLQGQQLIENSRVKSATNDFNGIAAAMFSYQDRYGRLPGDDPGATEKRGDSWTYDVNPQVSGTTVGDGQLDAKKANAFAGGGEVSFFFRNLRSAGFIAGDPQADAANALPQNPFGGLTTVVTEVVFDADGAGGLNGTKVCMSAVPGTSAIALDTQLDDGTPNAGRFRAAELGGTPGFDGDIPETYNEGDIYVVCYRI